MKMGCSYDLRWVYGSEFSCINKHTWGYYNLSVKDAKAKGLHFCPKCKLIATSIKGVRNPV